VALFPLWWEIFPVLIREGVKGPRDNFLLATTNIFEWDRTS
jgi:hypothetical protein